MRVLSATRSRSAARTSVRSSLARPSTFDPDRVGGVDPSQLGGGPSGGKPPWHASGHERDTTRRADDRPPGCDARPGHGGASRGVAAPRCGPRARRCGASSAATQPLRRRGRRVRRSCRSGLRPATVLAPTTSVGHRGRSHRPRRAVAPTAHPCPTRLRSPNTAVRTVLRTPPARRVGDRPARTRSSPTSCSCWSSTAALCDPLWGSIPITNTLNLLDHCPMGTPQRAILKRSNARSCFEPRRSRDPAGGRFARKPTNGGRAFWRPPTGPRDATSNTRASASDPHSGQYAFSSA